jgi:flagellar basal body-associated protein FliL
MADEPKTEEIKPKPKIPLKTIIVIAAVTLMEGGTIATFKLMHKPQVVEASDPIVQVEENPNKDSAEIALADGNVDNYVSGRSFIRVTLEVHAKVKKEKQTQLNELVTAHKTEIRDRIRYLVSSSQPEDLKDPKLQVVKRQIKSDIEKVVGDGLIEDILLPIWQLYTME